MSTERGVAHILQRMQANADLIGQAYTHGVIEKTQDNERRIDVLVRDRVLVARDGTTFSLHAYLKSFLDVALNIQRMYGLNTGIAERLQRLQQLLDAMFEAAHGPDAMHRQALEAETISSIYEIGDIIADNIAQVRLMLHNYFGDVASMEAKIRQNRQYTEWVMRIVEALGLFMRSDWIMRVRTESAFAGVLHAFEGYLLRTITSGQQELAQALETLRAYFFRLRCIERRTKLVRSLAYVLRRQGDWLQGDVEVPPDPVPSALRLAASLALQAWPDVRRDDPLLVSVVQQLPRQAVQMQTRRARSAGTLQPAAAHARLQQLDMPRRPYQQQLQNLMRCCRQQRQPVSARGWYLQHRADMGGISLGSWLAYVLLYCRAAKNIHALPRQRDKGSKRVIINVLADIVVQA